MPLIELRDVHLKIGPTEVLRGVNLRVDSGQRLGLIGPSGAGKSSLLRVIAGLMHPSRGQVLHHGRPIGATVLSKRGIGMLSQDYALYPQLTVRQNLEVVLKPLRLDKESMDRRIDQVVQWFEIAELFSRLPSQVSGGQAQRVAFAKAIVRHPELLLLDEPLSQLDSRLREQLIQRLLTASRQIGITLCWVTHDPWEAFRVATEIVVMDQGQIVQRDSPQAIYQRPSSRLVADLCSPWAINWLCPDTLGLSVLSRLSPQENSQAGIRPEHWVVDADASGDTHCGSHALTPAVSIVIDEICFLGHAWLAWGQCGSTRICVWDRLGKLQKGASVNLAVDPKNVIWVDR